MSLPSSPLPPLEPLPEDWSRLLAIAAHPDDLEYGTSCAVARWTTLGKEVAYLMVTRGEAGVDAWPPERTAPIREAEEVESARLVGVSSVTFLGYADGMVEYGLTLRRDLAREIRRYRPEALAIGGFDLTWPGGSLNQADHRAVGLAACDAARDAGNRWIFPELRRRWLRAVGRRPVRLRQRLADPDARLRRRGRPGAGHRLAGGPARLLREPRPPVRRGRIPASADSGSRPAVRRGSGGGLPGPLRVGARDEGRVPDHSSLVPRPSSLRRSRRTEGA